MLKGAIKSLVPYVELPSYFNISSTPVEGKGLRISVLANVEGSPKTYTAEIPHARPTLLDVVGAFPKIDLSNFNTMAKTILGTMKLPVHWVLECKGAPPPKEGFLITLDVYDMTPNKHWEKVLPVSTMQLAELVEVLEWVKEANKMGRGG